MKWLRTVMTVTLAAFWLLAINHCKLEQIPGLNFISCCEEGDGASFPDKECETDGCASVESGFYKMEDCQSSRPAPPLIAVTLLLPLLSAQVPLFSTSQVNLDSSPLELLVAWQFSFRAAAPPRAPSLVS